MLVDKPKLMVGMMRFIPVVLVVQAVLVLVVMAVEVVEVVMPAH